MSLLPRTSVRVARAQVTIERRRPAVAAAELWSLGDIGMVLGFVLCAPFVVGFIGIYLIARGDRAMPAAGECPSCGYVLRELPTETCPECGASRYDSPRSSDASRLVKAGLACVVVSFVLLVLAAVGSSFL